MPRLRLRAALLAATCFGGLLSAVPGNAEVAAVEAPVTLLPSAPQPTPVVAPALPAATTTNDTPRPEREPGWITLVSSRAESIDHSKTWSQNPWKPELQSETNDVFLRYVTPPGRVSYTDPLEHMRFFGLGNVHAPFGIKRLGLWKPPGAGRYRFAMSSRPNAAQLPERCEWHVSVDGVESLRSGFDYNKFRYLSDRPLDGGTPLNLGGGEASVSWWLSCAATTGRLISGHSLDKAETQVSAYALDVDVIRWQGLMTLSGTTEVDGYMMGGAMSYSATGANGEITRVDGFNPVGGISTSVKDMLGAEFELMVSKDDGPWMPLAGIEHASKDDPKPAAPAMTSDTTSPFNDPSKYQGGWTVEGWRPLWTALHLDGSRGPDWLNGGIWGADWLNEDPRYTTPVFTLPLSATKTSTWSSMSQVTARVGDPRPYVYKARSTFAAVEAGKTTFAILIRRNNQRSPWLLRCGAKMALAGQEVFGEGGAVDEVVGKGVGILMGTADLPAVGGYPATLRLGCSFSPVLSGAFPFAGVAPGYVGQQFGLHLIGDDRGGSFLLPNGNPDMSTHQDNSGEQGVTWSLMVRGPHDEGFRQPHPGEFFLQTQ